MLRTGISHSVLTLTLKKKEPQRNEKQNENEEQKERALTFIVRALSFCGVGGVRTLVQTMVPNVFYMLIF